MKVEWFLRKLHNERGAAAVLTLSVILMLTALGTIALVAGAANVRMSGKTVKWSQEYYKLDTKAERYVRLVDEALAAAEKDARAYVRGRFDRVDPSVTMLSGIYDLEYDMNSGAQAFFSKHYKADWVGVIEDSEDFGETEETEGEEGSEEAEGSESPGGSEETEEAEVAREYTLLDYEHMDEIDKLGDISAYYAENASNSPPPTPDEAFSEDLKTYTSEMFDRVYFYMLSKKLEKLVKSDTIPQYDIVIKGGASAPGQPETDAALRCTHKYLNLSASTDWDAIAPANDEAGVYIRTRNEDAEDPREVHAEVNVIRPDYETILQAISTPIFGNPIWTNALSVQGDILVESSADVTITGDVYASGVDSTVNDEDGISVGQNAKVNIHGNVYTAEDLQVAGNGGELQVHSNIGGSPNHLYDMKKLIYGDGYFYSKKITLPLDRSEYTDNSDNMPFIYNDSTDQGNVYCGNLAVKEGVSGALLQVNGNLWTKDDVQMDGNNSTIKIGTTSGSGSSVLPMTGYIGLNPFSGKLDPNASSSVINNFPFMDDDSPDSAIIINSNFFVPGVAFYEFSKPDPANPGSSIPDFYKSAESVSARTNNPISLIYAYLYDGAGAISHKIYENDDEDGFDLITPGEGVLEKKDALIDFAYSSDGIYTNIITNVTDSLDGYIPGVALIQPDSSTPARIYAGEAGPDERYEGVATPLLRHDRNFTTYTQLINHEVPGIGRNPLLLIHESKTGRLGTWVEKPDDIDEFFHEFIDVNMAGNGSLELREIIIIGDGGTLDLDSDPANQNSFADGRGIVFCDGDLTISGDGKFTGTVICTGDLNIQGNPEISHDAGVVYEKLKEYKDVRKFFGKGNMGNKLGESVEYSSTSGTRTAVKRYRIVSWKELSVSTVE